MKKLYIFAAAALALASCAEEEIVQQNNAGQLRQMEITASMPGGNSRTSFTDGGIKWQEGDMLSVFVGGTTNHPFTLLEGAGENEATFTGEASIGDAPNNVAYYPYAEDVTIASTGDGAYNIKATFPIQQQWAADGSFGPNSLPMVAVNAVSESNFNFQTLGGWLQLYVKGNTTITKVVMKAKGHKIAGNYTVTASSDCSPKMEMADDAVDYVSLNCGEGVKLGDEATLFTFAVAPFTFEAGEVSFDLYDDQNTFMPNAYTLAKGGTVIANAYYTIAKNEPVTYVGQPLAAKIGELVYVSLQEAIDAVEDGETITLLNDVNVTEPAYTTNALNYAKAVDCTIDLNNKTLSANTGNSVIRFNISGSGATSDVTVDIKNGKIVAGEDTWCAVMASGIDGAKAVMNLENLTIESSKAGDFAVKSWGNAVVNAKNVEVKATNAAGGFYAVGGEMTLDDCIVEQKGLHVAPYLSMAFAVSDGGKMTINSGNYSSEPTAANEGNNQGTSHGSWVGGVMNSGGTLIIENGTFANGNFGDDNQATAARALIFADTASKIEINGGEFNALANIVDYQNNLGVQPNPVVIISGGVFSADPRGATDSGVKIKDGYTAAEGQDGKWRIVESPVSVNGTTYDTLEEAIQAAVSGQTVKVKAGNYTLPNKMQDGIIIEGEEGTVFTGTSSISGENVTIKNVVFSNPDVVTSGEYRALTGNLNNATFENCHFDAKHGARYCYAEGNVVFKDCTFGDEDCIRGVHFDGGRGTVTFNRCKLYGFNALGSEVTKVTFNDCEFLYNKNYNVMNMYGTYEYNDCTFDPSMNTDCAGNGVVASYKNCKYADGSDIVELVHFDNEPSTCTITFDGKRLVSSLSELETVLDGATTDISLLIGKSLEGNVTITQKGSVNVVIDGNKNTFTGVMTVFGNGRQSGAETLMIQNFKFVAANGASSCIVSPDKSVNNSYSYSHNVTVENCEFTDPDGTVDCAAIRHEDGGDKNWTVRGASVDETMHSILQVNNVEGLLTLDKCTVLSKNGANLNSCTNLEMTGCNFNVKGYAVRFGVATGGNLGVAKTFNISNCTLTSECNDGDAVIMFRASAVDATLKLEESTLEGTTKISGHTDATTIIGNY